MPDIFEKSSTNFESGVNVISRYLLTLKTGPGVYRMINKDGDVLYVGKAKNLKNRVASYTRVNRQSVRIQRMIAATRSMEFVNTHTEAEALLLESNLIKRFAPKYNILLRDDKSFPFILLTSDHEYPQIVKYRGAQKRKGTYFGPFASVWAVNETLSILQKAFLLRTCTDSVFSNRSRPCLLYQIKQCSGPCVGKISIESYSALITEAREFLSAGSQKIQTHLAYKMEEESKRQNYEMAAQYRDRIQALTKVQSRHHIHVTGIDEVDVIAAHGDGNAVCIQVFFFRGGSNYGNRAYFPSQASEVTITDVVEAFIGQFYSRVLPPKLIVLSHKVKNKSLLEDALSTRIKKNVRIQIPERGEKYKLVKNALINAREAHGRRMAERRSQRYLLKGLSVALKMDKPPKRIEVYDNSHISGSRAVGAMIVAGPDGFVKSAYRTFTIKGAKEKTVNSSADEFSAGDDYGMMREVLTRRFLRILKEDPEKLSDQWPDLVLIDGGRGHLGVTRDVFEKFGLKDIKFASIAKGPERNAGQERLYVEDDQKPIVLDKNDPIFYFIQRLRDEAHRFAIGTHRQKRSRAIKHSILDEISGVGPNKKRALLNHFGGPLAVTQAGVNDLERVDGISKKLANKIYDWFQSE